jgi:tetratricopeptide (TPR) repeat protein
MLTASRLWSGPEQPTPDRVILVPTMPGTDEQLFVAHGLPRGAGAFLNWAAGASDPWLVVLDGVRDPAELSELWPRSETGTGLVIATTRRGDIGTLGEGGRLLVPVGPYAPDEAVAFLTARLAGIAAPDVVTAESAALLARELDHLPLALAHAACHVANRSGTCAAYVELLRRSRLDVALAVPDGSPYPQAVAESVLLSLQAADGEHPQRLAGAVLALASVLVPQALPETVFTTREVLLHLARRRAAAGALLLPVHEGHVASALDALARYGLVQLDRREGERVITLHRLTARAMRESLPPHIIHTLALCATDALLAVWPHQDRVRPALARTLRAAAESVRELVGDALWRMRGIDDLGWLVGVSLLDDVLPRDAVLQWEGMQEQATRVGAPEVNVIDVRANLASAYAQAGRTQEAVAVREEVAFAVERWERSTSEPVLVARANLAMAYLQAGRHTQAERLLQKVYEARRAALGDRAAGVVAVQEKLAALYCASDRFGEAADLLERTIDVRSEAGTSVDEIALAAAKVNLMAPYVKLGRVAEAVELGCGCEDVLRAKLGQEHPLTLRARVSLAVALYEARRAREARELMASTVEQLGTVLGVRHPETVSAATRLRQWRGGPLARLLEPLVERLPERIRPGRARRAVPVQIRER